MLMEAIEKRDKEIDEMEVTIENNDKIIEAQKKQLVYLMDTFVNKTRIDVAIQFSPSTADGAT